MAADEACIGSHGVALCVVQRAITHKVWLSSNQHAATTGAGQPDEKHLKISAVALALVNRNWMMNY